jgi:proline iminopeptidase
MCLQYVLMKGLLTILTLLVLTKNILGQDKNFYFTTSDSVKLYVHTAGQGNPCLFIHGGPGLTSYIFEVTPAAKLVEQKVHMIYYDQRGSGRSFSAPNGDYSMKRMEKDIEELRSFFKIKKWSVMGHSFGGLIMTAYAKDYPEYIRSLVYVHCTINMNTALKSHLDNGTMLLKESGIDFHVDTTLSPFNQLMQVHEALAKNGIEYKIMFRSQQEKNIEDSLINVSTSHFNQDFQHWVWKNKEYWMDYEKYTKDILCPVLIITGTRDYAIGPKSYQSWQFKNRKIVIYEGGHTSYQEEPTWFAETVLNFLQYQ